MTDRFQLSYRDSSEHIEASLITTWDKAPTTEARGGGVSWICPIHGPQKVIAASAEGYACTADPLFGAAVFCGIPVGVDSFDPPFESSEEETLP